MLKGLDAVHGSTRILKWWAEQVGEDVMRRIAPRLAYTAATASFAEVAMLYQAADVYVAPYLGEGFNLPVLEAIACGLPVICTAGGPTDAFTDAACARRIRADLWEGMGPDGLPKRQLVPDVEHLAALLDEAMRDATWRDAARTAGPALVHAGWTWRDAVDALLSALSTTAT